MKSRKFEIDIKYDTVKNQEYFTVNGVALQVLFEKADTPLLLEIANNIYQDRPTELSSYVDTGSIESIVDAIDAADLPESIEIQFCIYLGLLANKNHAYFKKRVMEIGSNTTGNELESEVIIAVKHLMQNDLKGKNEKIHLWVIGGVTGAIGDLYDLLGDAI